jgi:type IV pilus assembly protein PilE
MKSLQKNQGFTLIEVMIAVVIIAVLAAIAYPSYNNHVVKTRRAAAAVCLLENQQLLERYFTTNLSYEDAEIVQCANGLDAHYQIDFDGDPEARSYAIVAEPRGQQAARDQACGSLHLTNTGVRSNVVGSTKVAALSQCW